LTGGGHDEARYIELIIKTVKQTIKDDENNEEQ
jgi:hypothetical protein